MTLLQSMSSWGVNFRNERRIKLKFKKKKKKGKNKIKLKDNNINFNTFFFSLPLLYYSIFFVDEFELLRAIIGRKNKESA